jgi:glutamate/tyrosine decarboxylase-like PLP-dependent enzyme
MPGEKDANPLAMPPEEMRQLGYRAIDRVVEHLAALGEKSATRKLTGAEARARFGDKLVLEHPTPPLQLLDDVCDNAWSDTMHVNHPRFFGYIPGPSSFVGVVGECLTSGFNACGGTWLESSAVTYLELQTARYLADCCGLPASAGGVFLSGGSMANLSALAVARYQHHKSHDHSLRVYCSGQTHSSVAKALRILGFGDEQLHHIGVDAEHRMDIECLGAAITEDEARGLHPLVVVANAGTTNTGAIDPLPQIASVCRDKGLWLHVDAAYGGSAVACPSRRDLLAGIELADSITIDPHKWLFQPYGIGCLLVRDTRTLTDLFGLRATYLSEMEGGSDEVNLYDLGPELTRPSRGLRLWFALRVFGVERIAAAIERGFQNAEQAQRLIESASDWEVVTPAQMGIVTFRYAGSENEHSNDKITVHVVDALIEDGTALVSTTKLDDRPVLRMCPINPATNGKDIEITLAKLSSLAKELWQ